MQSVYKDNELEAHVILAQMFNDGWLPVQQTLSGKSVRAWLKEYHPEAAQHPAEALQILLPKLKEQSTESGMWPSTVRLLHVALHNINPMGIPTCLVGLERPRVTPTFVWQCR